MVIATMLGASLLLALREIRRHLLRSFLTVLGIVIGVAAVIAMVTVGNGVTATVRDKISALGANTLLVVPNTQGLSAGSVKPQPFTMADVDAIRQQIGGIQAVAGQTQSSVSAVHNGTKWSTNVTGTSDAGLEAQSMTLTSGRDFTPPEEAAGKSVCIIGTTVEKNLFPGQNPVGQRLRLNDITCQIIGVLKSRGQGGMGNDLDDVVLMPLRAVQRRLVGNDYIYWIVIGVNPAYDNASVSADLERLLRERRHFLPGQASDFRLINMKQISDTVSGTLGVMTGLVAAIASISLIVGGIGIVNIMLVSVTERTREIGIRLAIGALAREVRLQFLIEAVVLCFLGGAVGIILAFGLSVMITAAMHVALIIDPFTVLGSLGFASLLGIAFGYVPAQRAAALNPIDALRHE
jgi:putative ABC transport system permease protein